MRKILLITVLFVGFSVRGQDLSAHIKHSTFNWQYETPPTGRTLIRFKKKSSRYNPLMYVGAAALFVYQRVFSEQIQAECIYVVSCSEFTKHAIEHRGFVRGVLAGFNQVTECFNGAVYEHPSLFISKSRIVNVTEETGY